MNQAHPTPNPNPNPGAQVDGLLEQAQAELAGLDQLTTHEQVAGYQRIHESLAQALARTAETPGQPNGRPVPGRPGA